MLQSKLAKRKTSLILVSLLTLGSVPSFVAGCGGGAAPRNQTLDPERGGGTLEQIGLKFQDTRPSLSRDGLRAVFVSGRETSDTAAVTKAFKVDWPAGGAPQPAARVTSADLGVERDALISPDGSRVVLTAVKDSRTDIYLQSYADAAAAPLALTADAAVESSVAFSPDGNLLAWVSREPGEARGKVWLLSVANLAANQAPAPVSVIGDNESARLVFFLPADSGYQLAIGLQPAGKGALDIKIKAFADVGAAAAAAATDWLTGFVPGEAAPAVAQDAARVALARRLPGLVARTPARSDLVEKAEDRPATEALVLASGGASEVVSPQPASLQQILAAGLSRDGSRVFALGRGNYLCDEGDGFRYGSLLMTGAADGSALQTLVPTMRQDGTGFDVLTDLCAKRADNSYVRIDDKMTDLRLNGDATPESFRMLYVTRFTKAFDAECRLRFGDTEVMGLDTGAGGQTIHSVSNNSAGLVDAARPEGAAPCQL